MNEMPYWIKVKSTQEYVGGPFKGKKAASVEAHKYQSENPEEGDIVLNRDAPPESPSQTRSNYNTPKDMEDYNDDDWAAWDKKVTKVGINVGKKAVLEGASDFIGNAIEDLRSSKPGLDREAFLDELYFYLDAEYGKKVADQVSNAGDDDHDEWYYSYNDDAVDDNKVAEGSGMYGDQEVSWEKGGRRAPTGAFRNPNAEKMILHPETYELIDEYIAKIEPDADREEIAKSIISGHIDTSELEYALQDEHLNEFAPPGSGDDDGGFDENTLKRLAAQWWQGDEDPRVEKTLAAAGWEIGQDEGYDNGGVFVVRAGDENGNTYTSWPAEELEGLAEGTWDGTGEQDVAAAIASDGIDSEDAQTEKEISLSESEITEEMIADRLKSELALFKSGTKSKDKGISKKPAKDGEIHMKVNELSVDTLKSYDQKVSADSQKHPADPSKRKPEKASRSVAGHAKAHARLEKKAQSKKSIKKGSE
jgi:hypothetical protein